MKDITEILQSSGIEIPEEKKETFLKDFRNSYKSVVELDKLKEKNVTLEKTLTEYNSTIENYKSIDVDGLKSEIKKWQDKFEQTEKEYKEKTNKRLLEDEFKKVKFTSNTAKNSIFEKALSNEKIKFEDDKVTGFEEFINEFMEQDPAAFIMEQKDETPKFTRLGNQNHNMDDPSKMDFETYKKWRKEHTK